MKVGDKVKVKSWEEILKTLNSAYYCLEPRKDGEVTYFNKEGMFQYLGLTGTISKIDKETGDVRIESKVWSCDWWWHPSWLELIPEELDVDKNCSSKWLIFCMIFQYLSGNCPNPSIFGYAYTPLKKERGFDFSDFEYDFINIFKERVPFPDWPILNLPLDEAYTILEHCYKYETSKKDLEFFTQDVSSILFGGFPWTDTPENQKYWNDRYIYYSKIALKKEELKTSLTQQKISTTQIKTENYETKLQRKKSIVIRGTVQKEVSRAVENAKLQLQSDILATQSALEDKKQELDDAKSTYPLNAITIVNLMTEVEGLEDGLKKLKALQEELGL